MREPLIVISLDRTPERFQRFVDLNKGVKIQRFRAIDGTKLRKDACIRQGLITADNTYNPGALGVALSHVMLWRDCAAGTEQYHIAEDDVVLRADFWKCASDLLQRNSDWDIVLWSHNFDWPVMVAPGDGVWAAAIQYLQPKSNFGLEQFRGADRPSILLPLISSAGIGCYSISPSGAARMLSDCLPIGAAKPPYVLNPSMGWENSGIDVEMSRHYSRHHAYIAIPPIALAPNDHSLSTIRGASANSH